jgi:hypothetical protein
MSGIIRGNTTIGKQQTINTYVGGIFTKYLPDSSKGFVSLQPTGYKNNSFNIGGSYFSGYVGSNTVTSVNSIAVQSDGKILVGGNFKYYITKNNVYVCTNLVRLNTDGSLDAAYTGTTFGFNEPVLTVAVDYYGRAVVGGIFTSYDGVNNNRIIRFSSDTTVDTTFTPEGFNSDVFVIVPTPYHKLSEFASGYTYLVGGRFTGLMVELDYSGQEVSGSQKFKTFTGTSVNTIALDTILYFENDISQSAYKVYIGGNFTGYDSQYNQFNNIISTSFNGAINYSTFSGSTDGFDAPVKSIVVHPDNKLLVGGDFTVFSGNNASSKFIILNMDGTAQVRNFDFNASVNTIALDCCGKFLVGGDFTTVYGSTVNYITRFIPDASGLDRTFISNGFDDSVKTIYYSKS